MIYFKATSPTTGAVNITVDTNGGFLYGTATFNLKTGAVTNGKVTGGTGASPEPPERSKPRPSPAPRPPSRSPTAANQVRQPHGGGTVPAARPSRLAGSRSTSKPAHYPQIAIVTGHRAGPGRRAGRLGDTVAVADIDAEGGQAPACRRTSHWQHVPTPRPFRGRRRPGPRTPHRGGQKAPQRWAPGRWPRTRSAAHNAGSCLPSPAHQEVIMNHTRRVCRFPAGRARRTSAQLACSTAVPVVRATAGSRPTGCNDPAPLPAHNFTRRIATRMPHGPARRAVQGRAPQETVVAVHGSLRARDHRAAHAGRRAVPGRHRGAPGTLTPAPGPAGLQWQHDTVPPGAECDPARRSSGHPAVRPSCSPATPAGQRRASGPGGGSRRTH